MLFAIVRKTKLAVESGYTPSQCLTVVKNKKNRMLRYKIANAVKHLRSVHGGRKATRIIFGYRHGGM